MPKDKTAATLTIHRAADMHSRGRRRVVAWLRRQADVLERESDKLARCYTARYQYR